MGEEGWQERWESRRERPPRLVPDDLTRLVDQVLGHALAQLARAGDLTPVLFYVKDGHLHVVPLDYQALVESGHEVRWRTARGQVLLNNLGFCFAMWAIALSERAQNTASQEEDRARLLAEAEGLLLSTQPQAIVTARPSENPREVVVIGGNPVRTHVRIAHLLNGEGGLLRYQVAVLDNFFGSPGPRGSFAKVFMPHFS